MGISFHHPLFLLLLPLALYPVYLWYRSAWQLQAARRTIITVLRVSLITFLLLALAGLQIRYEVDKQNVVFLVDLSSSCEKGREMAEDFIREALKNKQADDQAGVVVFGENARVDRTLSADGQLADIESLVDDRHSNIQKALQLADAMLPDGSQKRLVLLSDGRENDGDALKEVEFLAAKNVRVDVLPLEVTETPDARIESLQIPQKLFAGEKFPLKVRVNSNVSTGMLLRIYRDRTLIGEERVKLNRGENQFVYTSSLEESGFYTYKVTAEFDQDTIPENNEASAFALVHGAPRVLLVEGQKGETKSLISVLQSLGLETDMVSPWEIPPTLAELKRYAVLILSNVAAEDIRNETMEAIHSGVRDLGMGLIMLGGEQSFGPGGYYKTPVEKALPVYMDLRGKAEIPSLGLVLVIDKSGSMSGGGGGYSKIELAKEAAIQATGIMGPMDKIGVVCFDEASKWVVEMQNVDDLQAIQDDIATIRADGGTNIFPGLALAYSALKDVDTKYKHIILLTDGQSATSGDYYYLARRMEREKITMSTVAVGEDADTYLMEQLAEWGQGRYYFSEDVSTIPKIFTKETMKALNYYLVEEEFMPAQTASSPVMEGITALPELYGYVATSPKKTSRVVLSSHRGDPVLAHWQYGLGRSVAFTSDAAGRWTASWIRWPGYNSFWGNIISWVLPRNEGSSILELQTSISGNQGLIQVDSLEYSRTLPTVATVVSPGLEKEEVSLEPVAPGQYSGEFLSRDPGVYLMTVSQQVNGQELRTINGGVAVPYSPEYRYAGTDDKFLERLREAGGGTILQEPGEAFAANLFPVKGALELWPFLLMLAALLLPLDIAARRLNFGFADFNSRKEELWQKIRPTAGEEAAPTTFSRLQNRKKEVQDLQEARMEKAREGVSPGVPDRSSEKSSVKETPKAAATAQGKTGAEGDNISRLLQAKKRAKKQD